MDASTPTVSNILIAQNGQALAERHIQTVVAAQVRALQSINVRDDASASAAGQAIKAAKSVQSAIEAARKTISSKLDAQKKELIAKERKLTAPIAEAIEALRAGIETHLREKEAERERAAIEAAEKAKEAEAALERLSALSDAGAPEGKIAAAQEKAAAAIEAAATPTEQALAAFSKVEGANLRTAWEYRVDNLSIVPRQFLALDASALKAHLAERKKAGEPIESVNIPGIAVFEKKTLTIR